MRLIVLSNSFQTVSTVQPGLGGSWRHWRQLEDGSGNDDGVEDAGGDDSEDGGEDGVEDGDGEGRVWGWRTTAELLFW